MEVGGEGRRREVEERKERRVKGGERERGK